VASAAAAVTLWHVPSELREVWRDVRNASTQTRLERQLLPARVVGLRETRIFLVAAEVIPRGSTYYVASADTGPTTEAGALVWVRPFATYWLLPRRRTDELGEADWVVSYGGDLDSLGLRYRRVIRSGAEFALAEVARDA